MPLVQKTLLRKGVYHAPQGVLKATRGRLASWVDTFKRMKAAGIKVPVAWGHSPYALPADDDERATQQHWLGAHNAGYVADLSLTSDGRLDGRLDCPGVELDGDKLVHWIKLPDGRQVKGAVGEVSVAVKPWKDGSGKDWGESLVHVALTPLPVAHGTGGFSMGAAAGGACTDPITGFTLSLTNLTRTLSTDEGDDVADDYEDDDKPAKKSSDDEGGEGKGGGGSKDYFKEGMEILAKRGLSLPDDTTPENFWERVCVAGHALEAAEEVTGEDMDGDGEAGEDHLDDAAGEDGATFDGEEMPTEEQPPVMMSLASTKDPAARASIRAIERGHKADLVRRIDRLVKRGLKPALAAELRGKVEGYSLGYTLSADGEMVVARKRLDERIGDLELSLPGSHPLRGTRTAREVARPDLREDAEAARRRQEKAGDELAELAGARASK